MAVTTVRKSSIGAKVGFSVSLKINLGGYESMEVSAWAEEIITHPDEREVVEDLIRGQALDHLRRSLKELLQPHNVAQGGAMAKRAQQGTI